MSAFADSSSPDDLPRLAAGFRRLESRIARVPASIDDDMHRAIHAHFAASATANPRRRGAKYLAYGSAIAALLALAAVLNWPSRSPVNRQSPSIAQAPLLPGDIDANARIDILDAFTLAREIEAALPFDPESQRIFDFTADGAIDQRDVDAIAMQAVTLPTQLSEVGKWRSS